MGSVNSPLQSLDSLETHRFDEGVVRQALISEHSVPECDFVKVPVVRLTEVFRQAAHSRIITSAHRIDQGSIPDLSKPDGDSDFYFVQADDPETAVPRIVDLVKTRPAFRS